MKPALLPSCKAPPAPGNQAQLSFSPSPFSPQRKYPLNAIKSGVTTRCSDRDLAENISLICERSRCGGARGGHGPCASWGDPRCRAAQTYAPGPPGTDPEGNRGGKKKKGENISFECLSQPTSKTSSASKRRHFLSSPPSTLSGTPALRKGEIRASACSLSQPDREGSVSTGNTVLRAHSFSQLYFLFF